MENQTYTYWIIGCLFVIVIALLFKDKVKSSLSKKGFTLSADDSEQTQNKSEIDNSTDNNVEQGNANNNSSVIKNSSGNIVKQGINDKPKK